MSTRLSRAQYTVAIVGATGNLGKEISNIFLSSYKPFFPRVIAVLRDTTKPEAKALTERGAELRQVDSANAVASFTRAFEGVDIVINAVGASPLEYNNALFEGALKSGVRVYFPSEYGSDYRINDFPGWDFTLWLAKAEHVRKARQLAQGKVKIIAVYPGLFLEGALGVFGFDTANLTYTCVGSPDKKTALTSKADVGRALAEFSLLALSPDYSARVPDDAHIAGGNASYREIRDIVQRVREELGVQPKGEIVIKSQDYETFRAKVREEEIKSPAPGPLRHIMLLIAEGKMDFSENDDELINPDESIWKWKTVEDYVREVGGRPFS
ncbi:NAD(P)-binding protein [Laetiporus sulphureus 93-53]|uniref:NAD(P)-binding protein n=1 Tax=Laetiporus sulphureus 93-53 TaxID=1314785 RepID=A0A165B4E9_9APHY|nr:NAD(P)-binding protein [Laetiporus sulphureus 93-53]KZT00209.1 NAD(P)-binding protein [Laetiporus sulphureus 93-53]